MPMARDRGSNISVDESDVAEAYSEAYEPAHITASSGCCCCLSEMRL